MALHRVYLRHPPESLLPGIAGWVAEVRAILATETEWAEWEIESGEYDAQCAFRIQSVADKVRDVRGPVLLIEPVQTPAREQLRERLRTVAPMLVEAAGCAEDLWRHLVEAQRRHLAFRPMLPRRFVAAVLIVRKLERWHYWGGKDKGYLYADELAKGRGVDDAFADIAADVANDLFTKEILIRKPGKGKAKYALNPNRKEAIYRITACTTIREFPEDEESLRRLKLSLVRDKVEVEAGLLEGAAQGESADP
jgi:hypothetical protein